MKKIIKYTVLLLVIGLAGYKSVYFKKLSEMQRPKEGKFDAAAYAGKLWNERLPQRMDSAVELSKLIKLIETTPEEAFAKFSNVMGIGNYRYSLVQVTGIAAMINEDDILVRFSHADSLLTIRLATEYVYGNAIRDASGLLDLKDFANTGDLNGISEELNKIVRTTVLPAFKQQVKSGDKIEVAAAIQFNKSHIDFKDLELIPMRIKILK
jgi:predicted lipoprotein